MAENNGRVADATGLGNAEASEPHSGLGPTGAIPRAGDLPTSIAREFMAIGPLKLIVHQLDNGQRLVEAGSLERFHLFLATGEVIDPPADVETGL